MKYLEEFGKGLINFANIGTVLLFFKAYIGNFDIIYLVDGVLFFIIFYSVGVRLIKKSEEIDNES